jgi:hypothetical protein
MIAYAVGKEVQREPQGISYLSLRDRALRQEFIEAWPAMTSGHHQMYLYYALHEREGADLESLRGCRGAAIPRQSH